MEINYVKGDATEPQGKGNKIIVHVCNNIGVWGAGFVLAVSKRWANPEFVYRMRESYPLGDIDTVQVSKRIWVVNMIAQSNIWRKGSKVPPIRYRALETCLSKVAHLAKKLDASIHMPRIGCGLAGGKWEIVEKIVTNQLIDNEIAVTVYDLP